MDKAKRILEEALSYKNCDGLIEENSRLEDAVLYAINQALRQPPVSIEEAAEIIQALYEYGQIHTIKGVIYGESHERYLNRAMTWLHFYRSSSKNGR